MTTLKVKRKKVTVLVLTFSGALDSGSAVALGNYRLGTAGKDKKFGTKDDVLTKFSKATYDSRLHTVTLTPRKSLVFTKPLQIRVNFGGLRDSSGRLIDGDDDGVPGGTAIASVSKKSIKVLT